MGELILNSDRLCICGNLKSKGSVFCLDCAQRVRKQTVLARRELMPKPNNHNRKELCPVCRENMKNTRAKQCRECYLDELDRNRKPMKERKRRDHTEKHIHRPQYGEPHLSRRRAIEALHFSDERAGTFAKAVVGTVGR